MTPPLIQENGVCRFVLHNYPLTAKDQASIMYILDDLVKQHEKAFDFTFRVNWRIQIRIFGRQEDYREFASTNSGNLEGWRSFITNMAGYYSVRDHEVVTWRQRDPSYLANNILHECSHAILSQQFRRQPLWLGEGAAVYFEFPRYMRDQNDERRLKAKWVLMRQLLEEGNLPNLREFLNQTAEEFRTQPSFRNYTLGWSLVQLLMSAPDKRQAMNVMMRKMQSSKGADCATLLDAAYPGGLARMEKDWKQWIARGAVNVLAKSPSTRAGTTSETVDCHVLRDDGVTALVPKRRFTPAGLRL